MMLTTTLRNLFIGATLWTASAQRGRDKKPDDRDENELVGRGRDDDKCWTCDQTPGCFECLSMSDNGDGTATVELDFSQCKDADTIGWACCTGSSGADGEFNQGDCEVPRSGCFGKDDKSSDPKDGAKCEGVSSMFVVVPSEATSVVINTHDGRTGNDASPAVGADPICAGREFQGGRCAMRDNSITAHCLETIDLSTCRGTAETLPTPSPTMMMMSAFPSDVPSSVLMAESDLPSRVPNTDEDDEEDN